MKKLVLFIMAVIGFAGMSVAQNVWSSGYYSNNGIHQPAVYKNGSKLYEDTGFSSKHGESSDVVVKDGYVYWVKNCIETNGSYFYGDIMKNSGVYLNSPTGQGYHINDLFLEDPFYIGGDDVYAVGCMNISGVKTAVVWLDDNTTPYLTLGDGTLPSEAYAGLRKAFDTNTCFTFSVGVQYTSSTTFKGVIWKGSNVFHEFENGTKILGIAYYAGCLYTVGTLTEGSNTSLKVWRTNMYDGTTSVQFSDLSSNAYDRPERTNIFVDDAGDIYVVGVTTGVDRLYKNGEEIYNTTAYFTSVSVNTDGVYYSGSTDNNGGYYGDQYGRIWKDGAYLYSPSDCQLVTNIFVEEPTCTNNEARSLPYFEGFETGATDWTCWTAADVDGQNSNFESYWHRGGDFRADIIHYGSDYCAWHEYNDEYPQEGWLISPVIRISEGSTAKLTFQSYERYPDDYGYEGVWVNPSTTAEEVWHASSDEVSDEWKTIEIDLSAYQGQDIVLGFKYTGDNAHNWYIDDVSVTEEEGPDMYTVTTEVDPVGAGTVDGGGEYPEQATVILTANPNPGWVFDHWNGGSTANPYIFNIAGDVTFIAYFHQEEFTLTLNAFPAEGGLVSANPAGPYHLGDMVTLTATPNTGYTFVSWQDGNTNAMRTVEVTGDETYSAIFTQGGSTMYTVTVLSENPLLGTVSGGGTFPAGAVIQISATPSPQARFVSWDDNVTDNPRTITVNGNVTYMAKFAALQNYTITVESANPTMGSVTGGGTFLEGTSITIGATAFSGYYFIGWDDGNADNPRTITVTQDATYRAQFSTNAVTTFILTVLCDNAQGSVVGNGTYTAGAIATLAAIPNPGFEFDKWSDNVTDNPRTVVVNSDMTFVAFFKGTGVNENEGHLMVLYPNPANDYVRLEGIEANSEVRIYNAMGALVKVVNANADEEIGISELSDGLYLLRCGNATLRFVKK